MKLHFVNNEQGKCVTVDFGVGRSAKATGQGIAAVGRGVGHGVAATGRGVGRGARATGRGVKATVKGVGRGLVWAYNKTWFATHSADSAPVAAAE